MVSFCSEMWSLRLRGERCGSRHIRQNLLGQCEETLLKHDWLITDVGQHAFAIIEYPAIPIELLLQLGCMRGYRWIA